MAAAPAADVVASSLVRRRDAGLASVAARRYAPIVRAEELANAAYLRRARDLMDRVCSCSGVATYEADRGDTWSERIDACAPAFELVTARTG